MGHRRRTDTRVLPPGSGGRLTDSLTVGIDARELQGQTTGTGRYLRSLLKAWTPTSSDRLVLYFKGPPLHDPLLEHPQIVARVLDDRPTRGLLWQEIRLAPAAERDGLDVFFAPAYSCPLRLAVPRVTTVHDLSFFSIPHDFTPVDGARRRLLVSASVRASDRIIAVSDFTRREIIHRFPDASSKVVVVHHGLDDDLPPPPARQDARKRLALAGPLILTVGSILNRRALPVLLRALGSLRRTRPDVTLDVVGENRTHPPLAFDRMLRASGLERNVRLSGFVSEESLADRYAAADVTVCLSEYEGFGLPVLESLARGVPVVVSRRPALDEIFARATLTVDPSDEAAIAAALDRILGDAALRAELIERGRALAAGFSWKQAAHLTRQTLRAASRRS